MHGNNANTKGILQVKSEESGSHFAMDTRTFREALSGQPMEEALAPDNNADRSYNGYRTLNRRIGSINAERNDNITGHTHSNHDGEIDDKKKSDLASILQTSATQSSVHISYDLPSKWIPSTNDSCVMRAAYLFLSQFDASMQSAHCSSS